MFSGAASFDQPINSWDMGGVLDTSCEPFLRPRRPPVVPTSRLSPHFVRVQTCSRNAPTISRSMLWNMGSVTTTAGETTCASATLSAPSARPHLPQRAGMFWAAAFDLPLDSWNMSSVLDTSCESPLATSASPLRPLFVLTCVRVQTCSTPRPPSTSRSMPGT